MEILFLIWAAPLLYLIFHYLFFHLRLVFYKESEGTFIEPVSVIVCAKNEDDNLRKFLPSILDQDYPSFEVLVVNDQSTDSTKEVLDILKRTYPHLRVIDNENPETYVGKKRALSLGINNASHEHLLLTDADCKPASRNWLKSMVNQFDKKQIILGYGATKKENTFVSNIVRWETLQTAIEYSSFALAKMPYMGIGRNLAYEKSLFTKIGGFESHIGLPSGDDDLFVSQSGKNSSLGLRLSADAFTYSAAPANFKVLMRQKRRHLSTATLYRFWPMLFLTLNGFAQLGFYLLLVPAIFLFYDWDWFWILLGAKLMVQFLILLPLTKKLKAMDRLLLFPFWEFCSIILVTFVQLQNLFFGKPKVWK